MKLNQNFSEFLRVDGRYSDSLYSLQFFFSFSGKVLNLVQAQSYIFVV